MGRAAKRIVVSGLVQGVGFRPFVKRLALSLGLAGYVRNLGGAEVEIVVEGEEEKISSFLKALLEEKPPPADIESIEQESVNPQGFSDFKILPSGNRLKKRSMIPPDFGVCEHCIAEVLDPRSRFYRYPFHSCAWCGPRFSMIERIPYDRENTSMRDFPLCDTCRREYEDIKNIRRFHIQGISCPACGPKVWLVDREGEAVQTDDPIKLAAKLISEGYIVAVKGLGGFHIACLATDDDVVLKLRRRKRRRTKPFAIMALNADVASRFVGVDARARSLLESPVRPIVLLPEREDSPISKYVAPGLDKQGVMLPYTPLHYLLLMEVPDQFAIMTSGNIHEKPMVTSNQEAIAKLSGIADYFLMHNRRIVNRVDDSVVRFTAGRISILRRARGYAPRWIKIREKLPTNVIAFGAELQNAGAIGFDDKVILTQFIGDTDEYENLMELEKYLRFFAATYEIDVRNSLIVADKHPLYASRRLAVEWAEREGAQICFVQHHHAHAVSAMAEVGWDEAVAITIDGVGYGEDGQIWGGEVLLARADGYERFGHLRYYPMPGGDLAVKYPVRMLIGYLSQILPREEVINILAERGLLEHLRGGRREAEIALAQSRRSVLTSSLGRFLDAVSALLGVGTYRGYEGEPAIRLEAAARNGRILDCCEPKISGTEVDVAPVFADILELSANVADVALTVQYRIGRALGELAAMAADASGLRRIVVSGGAAVNEYIFRGILSALPQKDFEVHLPEKVPAGDGGIALGQVVIGGALYENMD